MRIPLCVGNWKMQGTIAEGRALAASIRDGLKRPRGVDVVICPPFTALAAVNEVLSGTPLRLGAQNCHWEAAGAHTGEISLPMLVEVGCRYVLVGHSERRREIGETADERRQGLTFTTIEGQLRAGLASLASDAIARVVLAYEPVWAIGTGINATPAQAAEVHGYLRGLLSELSSKDVAGAIRILYGGSVKAENADALAAEPEIDGALVGGASLNAGGFIAIAKKTARAGATGKGE